MLFQVENLSSGYGKIDVVRSLSLHVDEGEHVGLFGPNGHGKTTLLRTVSGLIPANSGRVTFRGEDITGLDPRKIVELGLIHVPQGNQLFPEMTVQENLTLGAYVSRTEKGKVSNFEKVFTLFPRLKERRSQRAQTLSGGERQMLSIGVGLMGMPELLILDEPSVGLAPLIKEELARAIGEIAASGVTMIVVDQDVELLLGICERLYLIEKRDSLPRDDRCLAGRSGRNPRDVFRKGQLMTLEAIVAIIASGLVSGSLYALMASGLSLVWGTVRMFNFAHGALVMIGALLRLVHLQPRRAGEGPAANRQKHHQ